MSNATRHRRGRGNDANAPGDPGRGNAAKTPARAAPGPLHLSPEKAVALAATCYGQGKLAQAESICRQIIEARPQNADAHNILGASLQALGRPPEALEEVRKAVALAPGVPGLRANLGEILRLNGQFEEAKDQLAKALEFDPGNAQALNNLGIIHFEGRRYVEAANFYRQALEIRPDMAEAHNNLGNALRMSGDVVGAMTAYEGALTHRETYPEAYNNLGTLLQQVKREEEAESALRKAILQNPKYVEAHNNLASLLSAQKRDVEALRVLGDTLKIAPKNPKTLLTTARVQLQRGNQKSAEQAARLILRDQPDNSEALALLGQVLHETDRYEEALEVLAMAVDRDPSSADALNYYGVALKSVGRLDEARRYILQALALNDGMFGAYANLNDLVDFSKEEGEALFHRMEAIINAATNLQSEQLLPLHFAYGKALDDRGEHERALEHYITGGQMKRAQLHYNEADTFAFFDAIRDAFPAERFLNRTYEEKAGEGLVFIIGMPRSGSTLVEQILSSHPSVHGAGEVKYLSRALGQLRDRFPSLPKYPQMMERITPDQLNIVSKSYLSELTAGANGAKCITDKLLTNYFFVGLIHILYPAAKFIHTVRDPVDTCLSGFTKLFKDDMPHSYDLIELGRYYCKYRELMEHWQEVLPDGVLTTVHYENVVSDTESAAKALIEFLGIEWDAKCLDFHKSDRPVKTASVAQVRRPIYKTAVKRWKKYGAGLQPLVATLEVQPGLAVERA